MKQYIFIYLFKNCSLYCLKKVVSMTQRCKISCWISNFLWHWQHQ